MRIIGTLKIAGAMAGAAIILILLLFSFIIFDVMSYTAVGSDILKPSGNATGKAVIAYDPGVTGIP